MFYKGLIRKFKIEQQEQSFSEINNGHERINQKTYDWTTGANLFRDINNGLQSTNQKRKIEQQEESFSDITMVYKALKTKRKLE